MDEKLYENALCIELGERKIGFERQRNYQVYYKSHFVGRLIPDLVVDDKVIVETKVVGSLDDAHLAEVLGYLNITVLTLELLINFKKAMFEWKRVVR